MADVFVSYARHDKARVAPLVAAIEAQGWSVWWDPAITPGQEFDEQIVTELKAAAAVLVVWTPSSVNSRWVRGEARDGADRGILVPVRFDSAELPIDVRAIHTTDLDGLEMAERNRQVQEMLRAIGAIVARKRAARSTSSAAAPITAVVADAPSRVTICVLPFTNMSGDPSQDFFSDGLSEDIITELSRWRRLFSVRSRSASFRYRGAAVDMNQVARELDVRYIVEGSIRRAGNRIRISAQLIDTESGSHVWAERFDHGLDEIFAVQDSVVQKIVSTLVGRVQATDTERARRKPPSSLAAYECVLKGNSLPWDEPAGAEEAKRLFEQAITLDPSYAIAHALLAALCYARWKDDSTDSPAKLDEAYVFAKRAVDLDDGDSTCHAIMGQVLALQRSFVLGEQYSRRAVEINPNNQWNAADIGCVLINVGKSAESLDWFARAREIDPYFDPSWYWRGLGQAYMHLQRYEEAAASFSHAREKHYRILALQAGCYAALDDMDRARANAADCLALKPDFSIARYMRKEPLKNEAEAARLASLMRKAGLPE